MGSSLCDTRNDLLKVINKGLEEGALLIFSLLFVVLSELWVGDASGSHQTVSLVWLFDDLVHEEAEDEVQDIGGGFSPVLIVLVNSVLRT